MTIYRPDITDEVLKVPQVFSKHFASKNQLPGFYINETLFENGLITSKTFINKTGLHSQGNRKY